MLQSINDRIQGWLGWVIVALISVPFALWGIQSYLEVGGEKFVAKVNDTEISTTTFDRALAQQRARLQQMFGKNMPKGDAYDNILKQQVINQLVTTEVMNQYANEAGYTVANASLAAAIRSIEAFQENGEFSQSLYEKVLSSQGWSSAGFEAMYRQELSTSHVQNAIMASAFATESEIAQQQKLSNQQRNVSFIQFKAQDYFAKAQVTDEEEKAHFQKNAFRYMNPEKVSVQYLELKSDQLASEIPVSDDDIQQRYDDYVAKINANQQRKASHILVSLAPDGSDEEKTTALEKITTVKKELDAGANFAEQAKKHSEDPGSASAGGELGLVSKGMMVKPFEDVLFSLNDGQTSDVVRSEFGYHIIKLTEIKTAKIESFADRKSAIEKELQESGIQNLFLERSELLANLAYENPESLDIAAEQLKLTIKKSATFTRASGKGLAANASVRKAAFDDALIHDKLNSEAIEISPKHIVVIRVEDYTAATAKDFAEVKANINAELKAKKAQDMAKAAATRVIAQLQSDSSKTGWNRLTTEFKSATTALNLIKRDTDKADKQLVQAAFRLSKPESGKVSYQQVAMHNGDAAIVAVTVVSESKGANKKDMTIATKLSNKSANQEYAAVVAAIKESFDIYIPAKTEE